MFEKPNKNNRTFLVGPSFSGKANLMLKILSWEPPDRHIYIITKRPHERYSNSKSKIKEVSDEIKRQNEYENASIDFDHTLGASNSKYIDKFFIISRHNNWDFYCLSQSNFDLPKTTIGNNNNQIILFNQTLKHIEKIYRDASSYEMSYDEFTHLCRKVWEEDHKFLCFDRFKKRDEGDIVFVLKSKTYRMHSRNEAFLIIIKVVFKKRQKKV